MGCTNRHHTALDHHKTRPMLCVCVDSRNEFLYQHQSKYSNDDDMVHEKKKVLDYKKKGDVTLVSLLVKCGAKTNARDFDGRTPFFLACCSGDIKVSQTLYDLGADPSISTYNGISPLATACKYGHMGIIEWLVSILKMSPATSSHIDDYGNSPMHAASSMLQFDIMEYLIKEGCSVNDSNKSGVTALMTICETPADNKGGGQSDLSYTDIEYNAKEEARCPCLELLIQNDVDLNAVDINGQTVLHKASSLGRQNLVERLLKEENCNLLIVDKYDCTALHIAIIHKHFHIALVILKNTNQVDIKDKLGYTPLHTLCLLALPLPSSMLLFNLLCLKSSINSRDIRQRTPLFDVCKMHNLLFAKLLVAHGADPCAKDCLGRGLLHEVFMSNSTSQS